MKVGRRKKYTCKRKNLDGETDGRCRERVRMTEKGEVNWGGGGEACISSVILPH